MYRQLLAQIDDFRYRLADIDALPQLTLLGFFVGALASGIIVLFRLAIDWPLAALLPDSGENFEALSAEWRFALPLTGAVLIGVALSAVERKYHSVSATHVLDRLANFQGRMPLGNLLVQFFAGIACLVSGQSVGREGPAVHLGAGSASQLGMWLKLPNNSLRPLVGCGVAAAIAASFNTPVAGVIFAMEVILLEYSITGFIPVILAAVTGTAISRLVFGDELALGSTTVQAVQLGELPYLILAGIVIAALAAIFIRLQTWLQPLHRFAIALRLLVAGLVTGLAAIYVPQIMGSGYDTIIAAFNNQLELQLLLLIIGVKLVVTAISLGLGMPGGVIGPSLFIGACTGAAIGIYGHTLLPTDLSSPGFYALIGMTAMMAAVLNAPLAALIAVLELTGNPHALFPSMLIIVAACLSTRLLFHCDSLFQALLKAQGKSTTTSANQALLRRAGVLSTMTHDFVLCDRRLSHPQARQLLDDSPRWLVIDELDHSPILMRAADLALYLEDAIDTSGEDIIDLLDIPAHRRQMQPIHDRANLFEALQLMDDNHMDALYVTRTESRNAPLFSRVCGIITRGMLENHYQKPLS